MACKSIVTVSRPNLTEEERKYREEQLKKATAELFIAVAKRKREVEA